MYKLIPLAVLIATASTFCHSSVAAELRLADPLHRLSAASVSGYSGAIVLVGGMGGNGTGGGMTGATGGGMTGTTGGMGNVTGGGMTGVTRPSIGGATGYAPGGDPPGGGGAPYATGETTGDGPQHPQYYHCVTKHGRCSVSSELGARRTGASCSCLFGGKGKIR